MLAELKYLSEQCPPISKRKSGIVITRRNTTSCAILITSEGRSCGQVHCTLAKNSRKRGLLTRLNHTMDRRQFDSKGRSVGISQPAQSSAQTKTCTRGLNYDQQSHFNPDADGARSALDARQDAR